MGKFVSKIMPRSNPARTLKPDNTTVSRKVLYRRLQGPQLHYQKRSNGVVDTIRNTWGYVVFFGMCWIFSLRRDDAIPNEEHKIEIEKSIYDRLKEEFQQKYPRKVGES